MYTGFGLLVWLVIVFFVCRENGWFENGHDYSHEVEGKVLDLWDSKWKTSEQLEKDQAVRCY